MLNSNTIKSLSIPSDEKGRFIFDFSTISTEYYEPLLKTLQSFSLKHVVSLGFTCDELRKAEKKAINGQQIPHKVLQSIAKKKVHYVRNIVELLCHVLPKRTNIREVVISSIQLRPEFIARLANAFSQCETLESLVFRSVGLLDSGLDVILSKISPNRLKSVTFYNCSLSPAATNKILAFLSRKTGQEGIVAFNVSKAEFSDEDRRRIFDALGTDVPEPRPVSHSPHRRSPSKRKQASGLSSEEIELEHLKEENENLKIQLRELRQSLEAVQYSENVFIVGKGAEDFVKFLNTVESKIMRLEEKKASLDN